MDNGDKNKYQADKVVAHLRMMTHIRTVARGRILAHNIIPF